MNSCLDCQFSSSPVANTFFGVFDITLLCRSLLVACRKHNLCYFGWFLCYLCEENKEVVSLSHDSKDIPHDSSGPRYSLIEDAMLMNHGLMVE